MPPGICTYMPPGIYQSRRVQSSCSALLKFAGTTYGEVPMTRGKKKKRAKCEEAANNKKPRCDHYNHPIWMMALRGKYQARCLGCQTAGPAVREGPWAAQEALYST